MQNTDEDLQNTERLPNIDENQKEADKDQKKETPQKQNTTLREVDEGQKKAESSRRSRKTTEGATERYCNLQSRL